MSIFLGQTDDRLILATSLQRMMKASNSFEERRRRMGDKKPQRLALWKALADIGALGAAFLEEKGGLGGRPMDLAVVVEALAPTLPVEPIVASLVTAGRVLASATGGRADALVAGTIAGERIPILAHVEGFEPFGSPATLAEPGSNGGYILSGFKPAVRCADVATDLLVTARLGADNTGIFVVDPRRDGLLLSETRLIDGAGAADLNLRNVEVPGDALLEFNGGAMRAVSEALEWTLAMLCVEAASLIERANRATFEYLGVREQFGQKLASFQALQHRAADMAIAELEAAAVAFDAVAALSQHPSPDRSRRILLASLASNASGRRVGHEAIQLHGGIGATDELIVSHYSRRLAAIQNQVGTVDACMAHLARLEEQCQ